MQQSIAARQQFAASIDNEIAERIRQHQATIARLKVARTAMGAAAKPLPPSPLVMLAQGDSWFNYPLDGNTPSLACTDIIVHLKQMGAVNPLIANVAHWGETSTDEMSLPKQERMIQVLHDPANWLRQGKPDAILISAGGNDVAGDQFCISSIPSLAS